MTQPIAALRTALGERYRLDRELGAGGMATVFLAHDLKHHRDVAIKVLRTEVAAALGPERFIREIEIAARLHHPHILQLFDSGDAGGALYYVMPSVEGESVRDRLRREGPLPLEDALRITGEVADALEYAHAHGVVHRDIKPENILLTSGHALVADFGIARAISAAGGDRLTETGLAIGTAAYMSPEQASGAESVDARSDIYSLGCVLYEMLVGDPPFSGANAQAILARKTLERAPALRPVRDAIPEAVEGTVLQALARVPADRFASARQFAEALRGADARSVQGAGQTALPKALALWLGSAAGATGLAWAAARWIGVPEWVQPAVLALAALGLPAVLGFGLLVQTARRAQSAPPRLTPGGSPRPHGPVASLALRADRHLSWKRLAQAGALGFAAIVLLAAAYLVARALGLGPFGTAISTGQLQEHPRLLIADFRVRSADSALADPAEEAVRASLASSTALDLLDRQTVRDALARMRRPPDAPLSVEVAREIAAREGVTAIVDGEVVGQGGNFIVTLRLIRSDSGTVIAGPFQKTSSNLIGAVDVVARKLRRKVGEPLRSVQASPPLHRLTTSSLEALQLYAEAFRIDQVQDRIPVLRRAVAVDSNFATAWRSLAIAMGNSNYRPRSAIDTAVTRAYLLRDRLPEGERYFAEAVYFQSSPRGNRTKMLEAYERLLRRSSSSGALNNMGLGVFMGRRQWAVAESVLRLALSRSSGERPSGAAYYNLPAALFAQGKLAQAESVIAAARQDYPGRMNNQAMNSWRLTYLRGDVAGYEYILDTLRAAAGRTGPIATRASASLAELRGRLDLARQRWAEMAAWDSVFSIPHYDLIDSIRAAVTDARHRALAGRAVTRLDAALSLLPLASMDLLDRPYASLAVAYAVAGRPDKARAVLARREAEWPDTADHRGEPDLHNARAEIALAEGRPGEAILEFRRGDRLPDGPVDDNPLRILANLGRAFDLAGETDSAIAYFEQYIATPYFWRIGNERQPDLYEPPDAVFLPFIRFRLGELYEAKGDPLNAARSYRAFISLWERADEDLQPRVAEARRRVARLAERERPG